MAKVKPNNGNDTKSGNFLWDIFKHDIIFSGWKIIKYFYDFYNWHLSISLQR